MLQEEWIMTMKPLADRVLIKVEKEEEKTVGGLVLATKNPAGVPAKGKVWTMKFLQRRLLMPIKSLLRIRLTSFCSDLKFATWKLISKTSLKERIFL